MASLQQIAAAFLSATNENNAALASFKFDFSLLRVEAPAEWQPLGRCLNERRRVDAEIGPIHRTARRLAALFEQIIPSTPKLIAAYGTRVSEIIDEPGVNPKGSPSDGPFAQFVGADGTAMWAAATSGTSAIAVYLLACFLSRAWGSLKAVSIWVELLQERRAEIRAAVENNEAVSEATIMSTMQSISRDDLATWDASARSWLRSADQAKYSQLKQLELITKNIGLQFNSGATTYASVIGSWTQAMVGVESLLAGMPQQINDAAIVLAFSAWHLFPDLVALAGNTKKITFQDVLFPTSAVGTIGLFTSDKQSLAGIQWSLALSHLHHYGAPVQATGSGSQPRVTFSQLKMATLGCLFFKWRIDQRRFVGAAKFLVTVWEILIQAQHELISIDASSQFNWLVIFVDAARQLLRAENKSDAASRDCRRLVAFGYRRGWDFLGPAEQNFQPFFGLCNIHVLSALKESEDAGCGIAYLHSISEANKLTNDGSLIVRAHFDKEASWPLFIEYLAVQRHSFETRKRNVYGEEVTQPKYPCWFEVHEDIRNSQEHLEHSELMARRSQLAGKGYEPFVTTDQGHGSDRSFIRWTAAPRLFSGDVCPAMEKHYSDQTPEALPCQCFEPGHTRLFKFALGDWMFGLCSDKTVLQNHRQGMEDALEQLRYTVSPGMLWNYMSSLTCKMWKADLYQAGTTRKTHMHSSAGVLLCSRSAHFSVETCHALYSLAAAGSVFQKISFPSISLDCVLHSMHDVSWAPTILYQMNVDESVVELERSGIKARLTMPEVISQDLNRSQAFSCVVFFDSGGGVNLDPGDLTHTFAVSCENALYIAGVVLTDPAEAVDAYDVRCVAGNIGKKGISLLVAPQDPRIRQLGQDYRLINHESYNHKRENNFAATSLHLTFTEWTQALIAHESERTIDQEVYYVESVISVNDNGKWVADLDILGIKREELTIFSEPDMVCLGKETHFTIDDAEDRPVYTSVDSWEELLDYPVSTSIVRARGNWAARLAATSVLFQRGFGHCVGLFRGDSEFCLTCMHRNREEHIGPLYLQEGESTLPQFCMD